MERPQRTADFIDNLARYVISFGGLLVIFAVLAIIVFIAREGLPLFFQATAELQPSLGAAEVHPLAVGSDEYRQFVFSLDNDGKIRIRLAEDGTLQHELQVDALRDTSITAVAQGLLANQLAVATASGRVVFLTLQFQTRWVDGRRHLEPKLRSGPDLDFETPDDPIRMLAAARLDEGGAVAAIVTASGRVKVGAYDDDEEEIAIYDLQDAIGEARITSLTLSSEGEKLLAGSDAGRLYHWNIEAGEEPNLVATYEASSAAITALTFLLGDESLVVGDAAGGIAVWFPLRYIEVENRSQRPVSFERKALKPGERRRLIDLGFAERYSHVRSLTFITVGMPFRKIREFDPHPQAISALVASSRNKSFVSADSGGLLRLQHSTTESTLLNLKAGARGILGAALTPRADGVLALDADRRVHRWALTNPHPDATLVNLFTKVWYEGYMQPEHVWQSTGGTDAFEPKYGLWPLLFGTLKGTLYAMIFSVPLAIVAALYLSQLGPQRLRNIFKPIIEIMAALPSVVVGFLAALWFAPLLERNLGTAFAWVILLPCCVAAAIGVWSRLPLQIRGASKPGMELIFMFGAVLASLVLAVYLGQPLENTFFGADLQAWLFERHGIAYDQRNNLVVGVALGFAVIPLIFSLSEDAMSSVPPAYMSAALALGATKWQTALFVVLPAASPGIFSAILLGLGRAVGETMIVLMATGNTPILDLSPFTGMRTMSAAIAVEIPEAPAGGTLYRVLFLTGFLLFALTFLVNSISDIISHGLRRRYGRF